MTSNNPNYIQRFISDGVVNILHMRYHMQSVNDV